jgi:hypothetical protein
VSKQTSVSKHDQSAVLKIRKPGKNLNSMKALINKIVLVNEQKTPQSQTPIPEKKNARQAYQLASKPYLYNKLFLLIFKIKKKEFRNLIWR